MHSYKEYYTYLGYTYVLEYDEDEDTRKNMHVVLDANKNEINWKEVPDWGSYTVPSYEQFKQFVIDHIVTHQPNITSELNDFYMQIEKDRGNVRS
jgi:hypothetical protein|tara:strand:+ start:383 stop:667 length:285 start_codon:yes stop_codon:yes gene_type:complete